MTATVTTDRAGDPDPDGLDTDESERPVRAPFARVMPWLLTFGSAVGLFASATLNIERIHKLEDPSFKSACSISPFVDCSTVAASSQGAVLGFSNTILGVVAFSAALTLGLLMVLGGRVPRAMWLLLNAGLLLGVGFVHWLIGQSVFEIGVLCPYCMVIWSVTIPLFWYVTLRNLSNGLFGAAAASSPVTRTLVGVHGIPVALWFVTVASVIGIHFADSWATLL